MCPVYCRASTVKALLKGVGGGVWGYNEPRHYGQALIGVNVSLLQSGVVSGLDLNARSFF